MEAQQSGGRGAGGPAQLVHGLHVPVASAAQVSCWGEKINNALLEPSSCVGGHHAAWRGPRGRGRARAEALPGVAHGVKAGEGPQAQPSTAKGFFLREAGRRRRPKREGVRVLTPLKGNLVCSDPKTRCNSGETCSNMLEQRWSTTAARAGGQGARRAVCTQVGARRHASHGSVHLGCTACPLSRGRARSCTAPG